MSRRASKCLESELGDHQLLRDMNSDTMETGREISELIIHNTRHGAVHTVDRVGL